MSFGDIGGPVTELVITCRTPASGAVDIRRGDALVLSGPYTVTNAASAEDPVFGQALADCSRNNAAVPVRLRGVCQFTYTGAAPATDGQSGIVCADSAGAVKSPESGAGTGLALKTDTAARTVDVLL